MRFVVDRRACVVCGQCGNTKAEAKLNDHVHQHSWVKYDPAEIESCRHHAGPRCCTHGAQRGGAGMKADMVRVGIPDRARLEYAFWQYGCAVFCDQQEKWGNTREQSAKEYRLIYPPPPAPWLEPTSTTTEGQ